MAIRQMGVERFFRLVAEIMAGTQAPRSLGPHMLGVGTDPWDTLSQEIGPGGWASADEWEAALRERVVLLSPKEE